MVMTGGDIVTKALKAIGVLAKGEVPTADEAKDGLDQLNLMLGLWSVDGVVCRGSALEKFDLVSATRSYTIGSSQTFDTAKPISIDSGFIRDTDNNDSPLSIITQQLYDSYGDKLTASGTPKELFYDPGISQQATHLGTCYFYPIPDDSTLDVYLRMTKFLTEIASLTTTITFEPHYSQAIILNLAVNLHRDYFSGKKQVSPDLLDEAERLFRVIKRLNATVPIVPMEVPISSKTYFDINIGE